jgi:hypothetical protein
MTAANSHLAHRWQVFSRTPFACLLRLFLGRMFHGGGDTSTQELGLGIGAVLLLSGMPGLLVSLLMFEKYGSLIRYMRGDGTYDPFSATLPDEYFFLVLSMVITGSVALWLWDSIFLDRRDHSNLVPLPISLRTVFLANFSAILILAVLFAVVVNAASFVLFPVAVVGSQPSLTVFLRFSVGHAAAAIFAGIFSFFAVFALAGLLMAILPPQLFRRISLLARFALGIAFLTLLVTIFTVPSLLLHPNAPVTRALTKFPPVSILGIAQTVWGKLADPAIAAMAKSSLLALAIVVIIAVAAYATSFRRSFLRIPETTDAGPLPRTRLSFSPLSPLHKLLLRNPTQRACYNFIAKTLLRSDAHLQVLSAFAALGLVATVETITTIRADRFFHTRQSPSSDFLSIPFILAFCTVIGIRLAFEIPVHLDANWLFRLWLPHDDRHPRNVARRILLTFSLSWLIPATFAITLFLFNWPAALLHTAILIASTTFLVEILLIHFRKIPFTCSYPNFQNNSGVILTAYLFGFFLFTAYLPDLESWSLVSPARAAIFLPFFAIAFASLRAYRNQILDMDKQLLFEEPSPSAF